MSDNHVPAISAGASISFTPDQVELIKSQIAKGATDGELQLFLYQCKRTALDPLARQIYAVKRRQWDASSGQEKEVMSIQVSIDGFRLIAERSGRYAGQLGPFWCGPDGQWVDVWLASNPPSAARVAVLRGDFQEPLWGVARFASYKQTKRGGELTKMWATMPDVMIAKVAEALALRRAFPQELSGLYTGDEMDQDDTPPAERHQAPPVQQHSVPRAIAAPREPMPVSRVEAPPAQDKDAEFIRKFWMRDHLGIDPELSPGGLNEWGGWYTRTAAAAPDLGAYNRLIDDNAKHYLRWFKVVAPAVSKKLIEKMAAIQARLIEADPFAEAAE